MLDEHPTYTSSLYLGPIGNKRQLWASDCGTILYIRVYAINRCTIRNIIEVCHKDFIKEETNGRRLWCAQCERWIELYWSALKLPNLYIFSGVAAYFNWEKCRRVIQYWKNLYRFTWECDMNWIDIVESIVFKINRLTVNSLFSELMVYTCLIVNFIFIII